MALRVLQCNLVAWLIFHEIDQAVLLTWQPRHSAEVLKWLLSPIQGVYMPVEEFKEDEIAKDFYPYQHFRDLFSVCIT